jgi:hypothetical protein
MKYKNILFFIILFFITNKIYQTELKDRYHPFGGNDLKLDKFLKKNNIKQLDICDSNGKNIFWGKPEPKENIKKKLDKIEWLSTNYQNEIIWRKSLIQSILLSLILYTIIANKIDFDIGIIVSFIMISFAVIIMSKNYDKCHNSKVKAKHIVNHIHAIKKKLNIPFSNSLFLKNLDI